MIFSITSIAYLFLGFSLTSLSFRFFKAFHLVEKEIKKRAITGRCIFYLLLSFSVLSWCTGIITLFFNRNTVILQDLTITTCILLIVASTIGSYLIFRILLPKVNPWYGVLFILFIGLLTILSSVLFPSYPFLDKDLGINWDFHPPTNFLRFSLYLFTFIPLGIIFLRQYCFYSTDKTSERNALSLVLIFIMGFIIAYIEFILEPIFHLPSVTSDIFILILSGVIINFVF